MQTKRSTQRPVQEQQPKRAPIIGPSTAKTIKDWSEEEEDSDVIFAKSSIIARTPAQQHCTPPDMAVAMEPKKKETTIMMKLRGPNTTSTAAHLCKQSDEANTVPPSENLVETEESSRHTIAKIN